MKLKDHNRVFRLIGQHKILVLPIHHDETITILIIPEVALMFLLPDCHTALLDYMFNPNNTLVFLIALLRRPTTLRPIYLKDHNYGIRTLSVTRYLTTLLAISAQ